MKVRKPSTTPATRAGPPLLIDLGPNMAYIIRRLDRHLDALPEGGALAVDLGGRRVLVERTADGWAVDGDQLGSLAAVGAELRRAAADWLAAA